MLNKQSRRVKDKNEGDSSQQNRTQQREIEREKGGKKREEEKKREKGKLRGDKNVERKGVMLYLFNYRNETYRCSHRNSEAIKVH